MLRASLNLLLAVSLLPGLGACAFDEADGRLGDGIGVTDGDAPESGAAEGDNAPGGDESNDDAPSSGDDSASSEGDEGPAEGGDDSDPTAPADERATLIFDDGQVPFSADDPVFFAGGAPTDYTGLLLTHWAIDTVPGDAGDDKEYLLLFEHTGFALVDVACGDGSLDLAIDVYDLDGNLMLSVDAEGAGGLESIEFDATPASEPVVIVVRQVGNAAGRYVVTIDAAD